MKPLQALFPAVTKGSGFFSLCYSASATQRKPTAADLS
jgi:hypothetical protein